MLTPLSGKSVVVTGASRGIGNGIARVFARCGRKVLVIGRDVAAAEAATEEIVSAGCAAHAFRGDVACWEDMQAMADTAVARHGGIDTLISNAGIYPENPIEETTASDPSAMMMT
jgi:3-oxoacyl-[acyl-carrier protein] reductase